VGRQCEACKTGFLDTSRSKNKKYCSERCNTDAGHIRYKEKIIAGIIVKKIDRRDRREERRQRYTSDVNFKLSLALRARLNAAIKNGQKAGSAVRDLGCSIEELKLHLESKWQPGMSWNNWSRKGWHIDHVIPISSFNLEDAEELKKACHHSNLQPLWANNNLKKSNKMPSRTVYILAGPSGCGKTTLANKLTDKFNIVDYDSHTFEKCLELAATPGDKANLVVTPIQAKRMKKILETHGIQATLIYLRESKDVILSRISSRGGKITATIDRRIARYEALNKKGLFTFSGTWDEVYSWLLAN